MRQLRSGSATRGFRPRLSSPRISRRSINKIGVAPASSALGLATNTREWARVGPTGFLGDNRHGMARALSQKIAVVDVGSTSFKILIAALDSSGQVHAIYEEKRQVKLLAGSAFSSIDPAAMVRAHDAIAHFSRLAAQHGVPLHAIATAGLRDASNASDLLQSVQHQYGFSIQVISARSEAAFVFNGAMLSALSPVDPAICIDMGGGSTEVCVGHGGKPSAIACISLGSSKLVHSMPRLHEDGYADRDEMLQCMERVRTHLTDVDVSAVREEVARLGLRGHPVACYGTSGTIKCMAKAIAGLLQGDAARQGALTPFTRDELAEFLRVMEGSTRAKRLSSDLMKKKRVDLVIPGAILLLEVMTLLGIEQMAASETGLREGVVAAYLAPAVPPAAPLGVLDGHVPLVAPPPVGQPPVPTLS